MNDKDAIKNKAIIKNLREEEDIIKNLMEREDKILCQNACYSHDAIRRVKEKKGIRPEFSRDADRIIHSFCYTRYIDKTQVFYRKKDKENDKITHRVIHVQILSKIARFIGRCLKLNEDLIEAISLGHDVGHCPYGHVGEEMLSKIYNKYSKMYDNNYYFHHNFQSVIFLDKLERRAKETKKYGLNLTIQALDGILCHNGEIDEKILEPDINKNPKINKDDKKIWKIFDDELEKIHTTEKLIDVNIKPMTLEGCVVRFADTISYISRDIEDAIALGYIKRSDVPETILGNNNRKILDVLIRDIIRESIGKNYIAYSNDVFEALKILKKFNYKTIYENNKVRGNPEKIEKKMEIMFKYFIDELSGKNLTNSKIYKDHINLISKQYYEENKDEPYIIVKDYISGMTDRYFEQRFEEI